MEHYPPAYYRALPRLAGFAWMRAPAGLFPVFVWSNRQWSRIEGMAGGSPVVVRR